MIKLCYRVGLVAAPNERERASDGAMTRRLVEAVATEPVKARCKCRFLIQYDT